jgi:hypothetical protein
MACPQQYTADGFEYQLGVSVEVPLNSPLSGAIENRRDKLELAWIYFSAVIIVDRMRILFCPALLISLMPCVWCRWIIWVISYSLHCCWTNSNRVPYQGKFILHLMWRSDKCFDRFGMITRFCCFRNMVWICHLHYVTEFAKLWNSLWFSDGQLKFTVAEQSQEWLYWPH